MHGQLQSGERYRYPWTRRMILLPRVLLNFDLSLQRALLRFRDKQDFRGNKHCRPNSPFGVGIDVVQMPYAYTLLHTQGNQFLLFISTAEEMVYPHKPQKFSE